MLLGEATSSDRVKSEDFAQLLFLRLNYRLKS
jgi:hypothetical protein